MSAWWASLRRHFVIRSFTERFTALRGESNSGRTHGEKNKDVRAPFHPEARFWRLSTSFVPAVISISILSRPQSVSVRWDEVKWVEVSHRISASARSCAARQGLTRKETVLQDVLKVNSVPRESRHDDSLITPIPPLNYHFQMNEKGNKTCNLCRKKQITVLASCTAGYFTQWCSSNLESCLRCLYIYLVSIS